MDTKNLIRSFVYKMLVERLVAEDDLGTRDDIDYRAGAAFDAQEQAAKERYETAIATLKAWDINDQIRQSLVDKAKSDGVTFETAKKRCKKDPKYAYDSKLILKKRKSLEDELSKAEEEYAEYEPKLRNYVRTRTASSGAKTLADKQMPPKDKQVYLPIDGVKPLVWYTWPDDVSKSGKSFGSAKTKTGDEVSGTGPGEEWLAFIFGGQMQGGGVSYDIVTPDARAWEVKALESASETIRPGTEGLKAFDVPKKRLENIMQQVKNFITIVQRPGFFCATELDDDDTRIISFVAAFIEDDYEMIVGKGEVSRERFIALRAVLKALKQFSNKHTIANEHLDANVDLNIIDKVGKMSDGTLSIVEKFELLSSVLKDAAFMDHTQFFDEWFQSVDVNRVFEQVDGVFIVNTRGFLMVPKSMFKKAFRFEKVTQGKPRFVLSLPFGP